MLSFILLTSIDHYYFEPIESDYYCHLMKKFWSKNWNFLNGKVQIQKLRFSINLSVEQGLQWTKWHYEGGPAVFMTPFTTDKLLKCERAIKGSQSTELKSLVKSILEFQL